MWSTIEQGLAITAGSLATLKPLVQIIWVKLGLTNKSGADVGPDSRPPPQTHKLVVFKRSTFEISTAHHIDETQVSTGHREPISSRGRSAGFHPSIQSRKQQPGLTSVLDSCSEEELNPHKSWLKLPGEERT